MGGRDTGVVDGPTLTLRPRLAFRLLGPALIVVGVVGAAAGFLPAAVLVPWSGSLRSSRGCIGSWSNDREIVIRGLTSSTTLPISSLDEIRLRRVPFGPEHALRRTFRFGPFSSTPIRLRFMHTEDTLEPDHRRVLGRLGRAGAVSARGPHDRFRQPDPRPPRSVRLIRPRRGFRRGLDGLISDIYYPDYETLGWDRVGDPRHDPAGGAATRRGPAGGPPRRVPRSARGVPRQAPAGARAAPESWNRCRVRGAGTASPKPAAEITVLDVVEAIDGTEPAFRCHEIRRRGPAAQPASAYPLPCGIHRVMTSADTVWRASLRAVTVADLIATGREGCVTGGAGRRRAMAAGGTGMKVFLTGGTGVVGRSLVPLLVAGGHDVHAVCRRDEMPPCGCGVWARSRSPSICSMPRRWNAPSIGTEVVLHLATNVPTMSKAARPKGWDTHNRLRVDATRHLVAAARTRRVCSGSSRSRSRSSTATPASRGSTRPHP